MPRYYFHIEDGYSQPDNEGTELSGLDEAHTEAIRLAGAILRDGGGDHLWGGELWQLIVADDSRELFTLNFSVTEPSQAIARRA